MLEEFSLGSTWTCREACFTSRFRKTVKIVLCRSIRPFTQCWKAYHAPKSMSFQVRFDKAKKDAGIVDFRFHDLRHTAATRMADCGADAFALAEILGWSDVRMALRRLPVCVLPLDFVSWFISPPAI